MKFRACLDLYQGKVRQIVGTTLQNENEVTINYTSNKPPAWFAELYKANKLHDCHLIMLGQNNEQSCIEALICYPGAFRVGGGINEKNAKKWLNFGACGVIITSYLFSGANINWSKLKLISDSIGKENLIIDLSAASVGFTLKPNFNSKFASEPNSKFASEPNSNSAYNTGNAPKYMTANDIEDDIYYIFLEGWKTKSQEILTCSLLQKLNKYCHGFIIHGISCEGLQSGIDVKLIELLKDYDQSQVVYGGGVSSYHDIELINQLTKGHFDFTVGSSLDIFGGQGLKYADLVHKY